MEGGGSRSQFFNSKDTRGAVEALEASAVTPAPALAAAAEAYARAAAAHELSERASPHLKAMAAAAGGGAHSTGQGEAHAGCRARARLLSTRHAQAALAGRTAGGDHAFFLRAAEASRADLAARGREVCGQLAVSAQAAGDRGGSKSAPSF